MFRSTLSLLPRLPAVALALVIGLVLVAAPAFGQYQVLASSSTEIADLTRTETLVADGLDPLDRFSFVRLAKTHLEPAEARAVVLWLPALGVGFSSYEGTAPARHVGASIAGFFAKRNMVVYGLSSRSEGLAAGGCELGVFDCSAMAGWNLQTVVEDVDFVRQQIAASDPDLPVFVGGHSLGSISAIATINAHPDDYAGAFLWEGTLSSTDPAVQALNQAYCADLEAQLAAGLVYDGFSNNLLKKLAHLADTRPEAPISIPLFPPFLGHRQALVASLASPAPGPVSTPVPGYVLAAADPATGEFAHISEQRLFENVRGFDDYLPLAVVRDLSCSLAGVETAYSSNLGAFEGAILTLGGELGFGPYLAETALATGSTDVTVRLEPGEGHIDQLLAVDRRQKVERPLLQWIRQRTH